MAMSLPRANGADFVMVRIAGQQAEHFSFAQAWVSERESILPAFNFPVSKLAAFEEEFKGDGLRWLPDRACTLHC